MWSTSRFSGFHRVGLDITREYNIREDLGHVTPEEFMAFLEQFYLDDDTPLFYADSHTLGAVAAQDAAYEGPVHVDSFDAHGDLGYNEKEMKRAEEGSVSCSSWLYGVLKADLASSATVVYPDWKGLAEIEDKSEWKDLGVNVEFTTWSAWKASRPSRSVESTFVCRSSSWTPPWADKRFQSFLGTVPAQEMTCMDCMEAQKIGAYDACTPREWDKAEALVYAEESLQALKDLVRRNGQGQ
jgi:hypothetical protein